MIKKLTEYDFPKDLKTMEERELSLLPYAIRDFLVENVAKTGGHLASNLGVVELTIALHKVFDSPKDKIIWDVGHQSYVHKILTGRADGFSELRKTGGMSGFPKKEESIHDIFDTGHSSTSLSVAAGMAAARDLRQEDHDVIAVIGDGSMTGGMAYEALNNIGASGSKVIIILNDNGMSIDPNIGGISQHLDNLRVSSGYQTAKNRVKKTLDRMPIVGKTLTGSISDAKNFVKYALNSGGILWEELGLTYLGPVDGHDLMELINVLEHLKEYSGPVILHTITKKGKGYRNAELNPDRFHGIGAFDQNSGEPLTKQDVTYSSVFGDAALELAEKRDDIVCISAAMSSATGLSEFSQRFPLRIFDVGIAEAHAVTFAAGLATSGMRPIVAIYSSFLQRAYDQIIEDICLQKLPVIFAIDRAGIVGADGETHHGLMDIAYLSSMPGMTVLTPSDGNDLKEMMRYAVTMDGPCAIRYPRGECHYDEKRDLAKPVFSGNDIRLAYAKDVDIWGAGPMAERAMEVRKILAEKGVDAGVLAIKKVKPVPDRSDTGTFNIFTIEDGMIMGGFGEHVKNILPDHMRVRCFGWNDTFVPHGSCEDLYDSFGLDARGIAERIVKEIER